MLRPKPRRPSSGHVLLIEQAEALGEPPEDPLLLFSVLYGFWVANFVAFNGDVLRELAAQFLALAEKQGATVPLMIGHRIMGHVACCSLGDFAEGRAHLDQAIALYDPAEHRPLATRFGQDPGVSSLSFRSWATVVAWLSRGRARDAEHALKDAREIGHAATLMFALSHAAVTRLSAGTTRAQMPSSMSLLALADEKGALFWKAIGNG